MDYTKYLKPIGSDLFSCNCCGKQLHREDKVADCADCGAIFCEACVKAGALNDHVCENKD